VLTRLTVQASAVERTYSVPLLSRPNRSALALVTPSIWIISRLAGCSIRPAFRGLSCLGTGATRRVSMMSITA
jgi:hypothetical protein